MEPKGIKKIIIFSYFGRFTQKIWSRAQLLAWQLGIKPITSIYLVLPLDSLDDQTTNTVPLFDIITITIIFILLIFIFFLVDKQLRSSKYQSLHSIELLEKERDELEKRISERTLELISFRKKQREELERVARFGELSQGLFHDLINPLSAASLSIEQLVNKKSTVNETATILRKAVEASRRMSTYLNSIKNIINTNKNQEIFAETKTCLSIVLDLLAYKIRTANVKIEIVHERSYKLNINPIRLQQLFLNIISNAIESFEDYTDDIIKKISIKITSNKEKIFITILDTGKGIPENNLVTIFKKSFTTKKDGLGIGLITVRSIVEDELKGIISITNAPTSGALCQIIIPIKKPIPDLF